MVCEKVETRYITKGSGSRLVRYDKITQDNNHIIVKVWDAEYPEHNETLSYTRDSNISGKFQSSVPLYSKPSFEDSIWDKCQQHRDAMPD